MVKIAKEVVKVNGYDKVIKIINKRSTELTVGLGCDIPCKANVLVSEVFDSELIGEGAIETFTHAKKHLLTEDALIIPSKATVYVRLMESPFLFQSQSIDTNQFPHELNIKTPGDWKHCPGPASLWDLHLEEIKDKCTILSDPVAVGEFDFSDPNLPKKRVFPFVSVTPTHTGVLHSIAVYWSISMPQGVELSMSPWQQDHQWRDHWLPCVQILSDPININKGETVNIQLVNDEFTLWAVIENNINFSPHSPPLCSCGLHMSFSRGRLRMINDKERNERINQSLGELLVGKSTVLCVGDGSFLPLFCASYKSVKKIFSVETNHHSFSTMEQIISCSSLSDSISLLSVDPNDITPTHLIGHSIDILLAEPFFVSMTLPWHSLYFWYVRTALDPLLSTDCTITPGSAHLMGIAVKFENLHLLKHSLGKVEEFYLTPYDDAVMESIPDINKSLPPEDYSLWEYPSYPLSGVQTLMKFDFTSPVPKDTILREKGSWSLTTPTSCHGIVLWMEYSTGWTPVLLDEPIFGHKLNWSSNQNQGVCFFVKEDYEGEGSVGVAYNISMNTGTGDLGMEFELIF
ncbi:PREDICTED: protein arginine N-methyltransferase 7-like [Amphimedon queenslandica]|uniref:Protein arginine N-methyltransferase domain-containing protein n=1 Tax=Amphimedon queenslandica TaxID=400682 RepID=A0A1X7T4Y7_AMPQE|nr:PREDICTED: protein arginine N-methyltransferase 7-like [Amphimedon queenslandica]|eukprot:XP_011408225.2 PREDICTED: protein arginine N-methyltransferase 7-like [Amphimedon queenslandica]